MALAREYYPSEMLTILKESDGRNSPFNNAPGHCLSAHVLITDAQLIGRHGGPGGAVPVRKATAFKNFVIPGHGHAASSDMAMMVTHVLNSPNGQAALAAMDAGTYRRVSIVGPPPAKILGSQALGNVGVRFTERVGSANAFNAHAVKADGVSHRENWDLAVQGAQNMWILADKIDANRIHIHTCSPCDVADPNRPIGWNGTA